MGKFLSRFKNSLIINEENIKKSNNHVAFLNVIKTHAYFSSQNFAAWKTSIFKPSNGYQRVNGAVFYAIYKLAVRALSDVKHSAVALCFKFDKAVLLVF